MSELSGKTKPADPKDGLIDALQSLLAAARAKLKLLKAAKDGTLSNEEDSQVEGLTHQMISAFKTSRGFDRKLKIVPASDEDEENALFQFFSKFPNPVKALGRSFGEGVTEGQMSTFSELQERQEQSGGE